MAKLAHDEERSVSRGTALDAFVTYDQRLREFAEREHFAVIGP